VARSPQRAEPGTAPGRLTAAGSGRFELAGDVGFGDAARLLAEGDHAFRGLSAVEVDLAQVTRADSAGLALLLEWVLAARQAGTAIRYRNVPASLVSLADIGEVAELLDSPAVG
jgi:phospholipid transport system transporter-binding protein